MLFLKLFPFVPGPTSGSPRADGFLSRPRRPHHLWPSRGGLRVEVKLSPGTEAGLARRPGVRQLPDDGLRLQVQPGLGLQRPRPQHRPQPQPFSQRGRVVQTDDGSWAGQLRSLPPQVTMKRKLDYDFKLWTWELSNSLALSLERN